MNLLLNYSTVNGGGATQVALANLLELKKHPEDNFTVILSPSFLNYLETNEYPSNFKFIWLKKHITTSFVHLFKTIKELDLIEEEHNIDSVFTIFGPSYWTPKSPHLMGYAIPHYVYTDSPFFKILTLKEKISLQIKKQFHKRFIKKNSKYYHVETEDVRQRLSRNFNIPIENIFVASATIHPCYFDKGLRKDVILEDTKEFDAKLISISSTARHKNLLIINEVLPILKDKYGLNVQFVLTLPNEFFQENFNSENDNIFNVGPVRIENCPSLYSQSDFVFSPSLLECFSAVYPEAMYLQKPLIVSDLPFSRGVCKDAAVYFSPLSAEDLAKKIHFLITNKDFQVKLIEEGKTRYKDFPTSQGRTELFMSIIKKIYQSN